MRLRTYTPIGAEMRNFIIVCLVVLGVSGWAAPQSNPNTLNDAVRTYIAQHRVEIIEDFRDFLRIPNLASDTANINQNAQELLQMLKKRGLEGQLLSMENAPPAVLASLPADPAKRTVIFYAHYDGQPVNKAEWKYDPWKPTLVNPRGPATGAALDDPETRIYARSSSDDKAAIIGLLTAVDALQAAHIQPSVNLKFLFEGEVEAGSPHLSA